MLNPFPSLLVFGFFAPTILRLAVAFTFFYAVRITIRGKNALSKNIALNIFVLIEAIMAAALFIGYCTQIAALVGIALCIKSLFVRHDTHNAFPLDRTTYILLMIICLALIFTGAGGFAFDLPL